MVALTTVIVCMLSVPAINQEGKLAVRAVARLAGFASMVFAAVPFPVVIHYSVVHRVGYAA